MVLNTKIKRTEFGTNVVLIALFAVTGALMLLSAYGAACVTWDPEGGVQQGPIFIPYAAMFGYVMDNLILFQISNVIAWVFAFAYGIVIWAVITQKSWGLLSGLITSVVGFVFGLIPAIIADTDNFTVPFELGSPHWAKTISNGLVIITLAIVIIARAINGVPIGEAIKTYTGDAGVARSVSNQLMMMSLFFFWFSFMSFLGTHFMSGAHVVNGINVWELIEIQTIGGVATAITGCSMLVGGGVMKFFKPSTSFIRTLR